MLTRIFAITLSLFVAMAVLTTAFDAQAQEEGQHVINMQDADIRAFIDDVSMVTGKTFIVDPRVSGNVTIASQTPLTKAEVFEVFKDVMRVHGYTVIRTQTGEYRITLLQGAAQEAPLTAGNGFNGQMSTAIIRVEFGDAAEVAKLIKPVMHAQGVLTANPGGNIIVVTDYPENIMKARQIVGAYDVDGQVIESVALSNLNASDVSGALQPLIGPGNAVQFASVPGSNAVILKGRPGEVEKYRALITNMDLSGTLPQGEVSVILLRHADGEQIAQVMADLLPAFEVEGQPTPAVSFEPGMNALIISGSPETQNAMRSVVAQLDVRRPQVLVEAIIVEISDTAARDLGVQFAIYGEDAPFAATNFSRSAPNLLALTGALAPDGILPTGTTDSLQDAAISSLLGVDGGLFGFSASSGSLMFNVILDAVEQDDNSNVLSTPFITTLDNVPAKILVGQEIPITTGESLGSNNINPFRTFERQDVGIILTVTPQISEGDDIRLNIVQEVSSIAGAVTGVSQDFILNKREIETTVLAGDGELIVLGGLIEDDEQIFTDKVPFLGDIPVAGRLFQAESKSRERTNLMIFLRPTIIRSSEDARPLTQQRIDYIREQDLIQSGRSQSKLDGVVDP